MSSTKLPHDRAYKLEYEIKEDMGLDLELEQKPNVDHCSRNENVQDDSYSQFEEENFKDIKIKDEPIENGETVENDEYSYDPQLNTLHFTDDVIEGVFIKEEPQIEDVNLMVHNCVHNGYDDLNCSNLADNSGSANHIFNNPAANSSASIHIFSNQITHSDTTNHNYITPTASSSTTIDNYNIPAVLSSHKKIKIVNCPGCNYTTHKRSYFRSHLRNHTEEKPLMCSFCPFAAAREHTLSKHMETHMKTYKKTHMETYNKTHMEKHMKTYKKTHMEPYNKIHMEKHMQTYKKTHMETHMETYNKTHMEKHEKTYMKTHMETHMKTYMKKNPHKCYFCSFETLEKSVFLKHVRAHFWKKFFKCNRCSYRTLNKNLLNRHCKLHYNKKSFICPICSFECGQSTKLRRHVKIHMMDVTFKCAFCTYSTTDHSIFVKHLKFHLNEEVLGQSAHAVRNRILGILTSNGKLNSQFNCSLCRFIAPSDSILKLHVETLHGENICENNEVNEHTR